MHNRSQCVTIDHCFSNVCDVISGVPQGSVLGPILFLIFINDIESVCCGSSKVKLFADDAKLYTRVDLNIPSVSLQQSLDRLSTWAETWQLTINIKKCSVTSIGNKPGQSINCYFINGNILPYSSLTPDLGVTISDDMSFHVHINNIAAKAFQRISTFYRGFTSRNLKLLCKAFITYIKSLVEYNSIISNPFHIYLIDLLESVQRKFTKRVHSLSMLPYTERLRKLKLEPLELRRLKFDLINYFKILNSLSPLDPKSYFTIYKPLPSSRSAIPYLQKPHKACNKLLSSFFFRNVDAWNYLSVELRSLSELSKFKTALKTVDLSIFLKGNAIRI